MRKRGIITYIAVCVVGLLPGCRAAKEFPYDYRGDQFHFGQGGGFTGAVNAFVLLDDGRLFQKGKTDTSMTYVSTWKRDFTRQMFSNYTSLGLERLNHQHPGNLYYFIEFHSPDKKPHLISWGQEGYTPSEGIVSFYQILYKSTRSKS